MKIGAYLLRLPRFMLFWLALDGVYIAVLSPYLGGRIPLGFTEFILVHLLGVVVGTMVMFTGLGAGMLWIPVLTVLHIRPSEAVSISIFTQIAGKGAGSLSYLISGKVDLKIAARFIPMALIGVTIGYIAGYFIPQEYERVLLYIFLLVAGYLLMQMIQSLNEPEEKKSLRSPEQSPFLTKSWPLVAASSFFTGLLSIGNTDWIIPHMEQKLNLPTWKAVATGLFIMFITILFYLLLVCISVWLDYRAWPQGTSLLFATCSGVVLGGQIGVRLTRFPWFRKHQKHAFILLLAASMIHLLW
ncbi:protein of unknown function DUF81 [Desulfatibacillum aliphaticivorans]|uniref:Probable membrane transporter protein n=1 Tax=Desulfatibacillum aliphaticivorans TaxID=218208 RepID=B8FK46_DESAL|nr:sulfite exporter TauE/SafE family protein [Desulfatibacillum aliphaticivorans]ACL02721.1 protein of unknown function DUF81 [Desulfatibacillum aliphaticivorans]